MRICAAFIFKKEHIAGSVKTVADFFSRLELKVTEKIRLKFREDIQTTHKKMTTFSPDVTDDERFVIAQTDGEDDSTRSRS